MRFTRTDRLTTRLAALGLLAALWLSITPSAGIAAALPEECTQSGSDVTCTYTTRVAAFVVPDGVSVLHVVAVGATGGGGSGGVGGRGARVSGNLAVTAGDTLHTTIGGNGTDLQGGVNGGGAGCGGGGGASDVRSDAVDLDTRLLVAGGGGGGDCGGFGGDGGDAGTAGGPIAPAEYEGGGGHPGSQLRGGLGGRPGAVFSPSTFFAAERGAAGTVGSGGLGGRSARIGGIGGYEGGGGGGGLFGGGGGGGGGARYECGPDGVCFHHFVGSGGGGGGSSLAGPGGSVSVDTTGAPRVEISYTPGETLPAISFTSGPPPSGTVGEPYSFKYAATGDAGITFAVPPRSTAPPPELTLAADGVLSGTPTTPGTFSYPVIATGSSGASASRIDTIAISPPVPSASVDPSSLAFGDQMVWLTSSPQTVTLSNSGPGALTVESVSFDDPLQSDFAVGAGGCSGQTLSVGGSCPISVSFTPSATGPRAATLKIFDNAGNSPQTVALTGTGTAPGATVSPTSLDFGNQEIGATSSPRSVTLSNTGDAPLTVATAGIGGTDAGNFAKASDTCSGQAVEPGASCVVEVTFTSASPGSRSATLSFSDNAPGSPHTASLSGTGVEPAADLAVSNAATPNPVKSGGQLTYTITVLNAGPSAAADVLVNDTLSSQSTFVSAKPSQGSCITPVKGASGTLSCNLGSIGNGAYSATQIVVKVIAKKTTITNTATVSSSTNDPNQANNSASITTRVK